MGRHQAEQVWEAEARALAALADRPLLARRDHVALAETPGSAWFDALGNALALEALSHPLLAAQHTDLRAGIETFLGALLEQGVLRRRAGPSRLAVRSDDPRRLHIETPSHVFTGDLRRGELVQALRTAPDAPVARHTGNMVSFRLGGRDHTVDAEDTITNCGVLHEAGWVRLFHESRIMGRGRFRWRDRPVGTLRYDYTIRADTPVLAVEVTFTPASGAMPEAIQLSTALDAMSPSDAVAFRRATLDGTARDGFLPGAAMELPGPARAVSFHQGGAPACALAIHLRPRDPAALQSLTVTGDGAGRAHWALLRHAGAAIAEERLVLSGDPRPDVGALFARTTSERGRDAALCPAPAMAAQALALRHLWHGGDAAPLLRLLDMLHAAGDDPAFLTLAEDACVRAGLRDRHGTMLDRLLASGDSGPAALLALARAATLAPGDPRLAPVVARILATLDAAPPEDALDRALLLRALRATQAVRVLGALVLEEEARAQAARLTLREEHPCVLVPDASTALRAARLLARLAPDALVMRVQPARAA